MARNGKKVIKWISQRKRVMFLNNANYKARRRNYSGLSFKRRKEFQAICNCDIV